jgi:hypothetical protein
MTVIARDEMLPLGNRAELRPMEETAVARMWRISHRR